MNPYQQTTLSNVVYSGDNIEFYVGYDTWSVNFYIPENSSNYSSNDSGNYVYRKRSEVIFASSVGDCLKHSNFDYYKNLVIISPPEFWEYTSYSGIKPDFAQNWAIECTELFDSVCDCDSDPINYFYISGCTITTSNGLVYFMGVSYDPDLKSIAKLTIFKNNQLFTNDDAEMIDDFGLSRLKIC